MLNHGIRRIYAASLECTFMLRQFEIKTKVQRNAISDHVFVLSDQNGNLVGLA